MQHKNLRGSDLHAPSSELVENDTGSTIPVLKAVRFDGQGALFPKIVLANSNVDIVRGITQSAILSGQSGYITSMGFLNGVDTSAWAPNTQLYADSSGNITNAPINLPVATVLKQDAVNGIVYVNTTGIIKSDLDSLTFPDPLSLELAWDINHPSFYTEPTYDVNGRVTRTDVWDTPSKGLHIFSKIYTYTTNQLTKVAVTREFDGKALVKDLTYDVNGRITSIVRSYTP